QPLQRGPVRVVPAVEDAVDVLPDLAGDVVHLLQLVAVVGALAVGLAPSHVSSIRSFRTTRQRKSNCGCSTCRATSWSIA
ncbi:MAG: hypothetical protein ABEL76_12440, partial [Bradymonadaceae bacterium]